jgi:hypothetical protein
MKPSYLTATAVGAVSGVVIALSIFAFVGATGAIPSLTAEVQGSQVVPTFEPSASATWQLVVLSGLVGGMLIAIITRAVGRVLDPDAKSSLAVVVPLGAFLGAVGSMAVIPLGVSVLGSVDGGLVIIGVADFVLLAALAGLVAGGIVAWLTYVIVRPPAYKEDTELLNV